MIVSASDKHRTATVALAATLSLLSVEAAAQDGGSASPLQTMLSDRLSAFLPDSIPFDLVLFAVFTGAFAFAMGAATWLILEKTRLAAEHRAQTLELSDLRVRYDRAEALLDVADQRVAIWPPQEGPRAGEPPMCRGTLPANTGAPSDPKAFIGFGVWMAPASAQEFEHAVGRLRSNAEAFDLTLETKTGAFLDAQGRASGAHAFVRFLSLSGERAALASLESEHRRLMATTDTMKSLLDAVPLPVWLRDGNGGIDWANTSYLKALDEKDLAGLRERGTHLLDTADRTSIHKALETADVFHERLAATVGGDRRMMEVTSVGSSKSGAGLAIDMSEVEEVRTKLRRTQQSHTEMLNKLATAVAIFDDKRRLVFHNQAFEQLWSLDAAFLAKEPDNSHLLDRLREKGVIGERADWATWRNGWLETYSATEPKEDWWHLPDGRTVRVVANPQSQGGVTWIFENITEQLDMQTRMTAQTKVQRETLDHMAEAIAVFAPNGRLRLSNPAFAQTFSLSADMVAEDTPIADIAKAASHIVVPEKDADEDSQAVWERFVTGVTGVSEAREAISGHMTLEGHNGPTNHDYALVPLPNGQTMISFADVTASVRMKDALVQRNEALEQAERLKNAFIENVSYEFRAPLTNIKGFSEMLAERMFGPLNEKQDEYVDHIRSSSNVLTALVDNLLDLAAMDAGQMELEHEPIVLHTALTEAVNSVGDLRAERSVHLKVHSAGGDKASSFEADPRRFQQVLHNLLSNAIKFSPPESTVRLETVLTPDAVEIAVSDEGPGVPEEDREAIFGRFETRAVMSGGSTSGRSGAGLGLSIARALMELHDGTIEVDSDHANGARFVCRMPRQHSAAIAAAE